MITAALLQKLLAIGVPKLVEAVTKKGVEVVNDKLGIDLEDLLSKGEEGIDKIKKLEIERAVDLNHLLDVQNARQRDMATTNSNAPTFKKIFPELLGTMVVASTIALFALILSGNLNIENKEILMLVVGALIANITQVIQFYFGSSKGSKDKDEAIQRTLSR